jgi:endoglucanase
MENTMTARHLRTAWYRSALRAASILALACWLAGTAAFAQKPDLPKPAAAASKTTPGLRLNDRDYFETRGLNVLVFTNQYNGMFFDEKTAGVEIIVNGVRLATGGAVRLSPTPEQWDQIPKVIDRKVDKATSTITCSLRYEAFDFDSRLVVSPDGAGFRVAVYVDKPVPEKLEGRAGFNLEFLPSRYFGRTYLADGKPGIFPRYPIGPTETKPGATKIRQFEGYSTFDDRGRNDYPEAHPVAAGTRLVLAPEDPERRVSIQAVSGELQLLDGRNLSQNGWFIVRSPLATKTTGKVAEWVVRPNAIPNWTRTPVIGFSQVGYHPSQKKVAVIELDANDTPLPTASLFEVTADGVVERLRMPVKPWGPYLRYRYVTADFSGVDRTGLYYVKYGTQKTETFPIAANVYDTIWHATSDVWFPVQMDHMMVNEAYRVWHGLTHMDDALQAPLNFQQFDGYRMGATTDTKYKPLERIPGLAVGGWFDAGDFDMQGGSHAGTLTAFVDVWETFKPQRDQTLVDQATRFVDIHVPDGKPDILQQIEHGALQVAAQYRSIGQLNQGVVDSQLHRYHHLGDASTQTDNLLYDPSLKPYQVEGNRSGTMDDRFVFTTHQPFLQYSGIGSLAAASRALRGYNDALADECLALAKKAYTDERQRPATPPPTGGAGGGARSGPSAELSAVLQLMISTKDPQYVQRFDALIWPALDAPGGRSLLTAVKALPYLGAGAVDKLRPYVVKYKAEVDGQVKANPYGVPIATGGWAGSGGVVTWATTNYYLHKTYPDLFDAESVYRGLHFVFGTHPASNTSFVATVGTASKKLAYGNNRADFTFIPGVVVPGVLILKPDYPENMDDWPFLWGENEGTITGAAQYIFLANAAAELVRAAK